MWRLSITEPDSAPRWINLHDGKTSIGRSSENMIILQDVSASRFHAEILCDSNTNTIYIHDHSSTNGTFVNRQRIDGRMRLSANDIIRIGQAIIYVSQESPDQRREKRASGTHRFTRELLLESLDENAILLYEIARKLNTVTDLKTAEEEIASQLRRAMGVEDCHIIHHSQFQKLREAMPHTAALHAIEKRAAEVTTYSMFVPILSGDDVLGLMFLGRSKSGTRPFSKRDLQLAIAISYQASLTFQRIELLFQLRDKERIQQLLYRFVPPAEAEHLIQDYLRSGHLPGLREEKISILFSDMASSTALAEAVGPQRFAHILNSYYREATSIVFRHGGTVRYLGDGIMAIFEDHITSNTNRLGEERAVLAGREILEKIRGTDFGDGQEIIIGVAVNTGKAMIGYIGSDERAEFNALGDTVNVAFRMQDLARPYRLVVGPATVAAIVNKYETQRIGAVSLRGREKPVQVYEVIGPLDRQIEQ